MIESSERRNSRRWKNSPYDAKQKSKLYSCYVSGDIFKNATATKVQEFDGSGIEELVAVDYIQFAIGILKTKKDKPVLILSSSS